MESDIFENIIIAEIIGGVVSGIVVGFILYLVFDKILIKRPKVRLYISPDEPDLDEDNEFKLEFYLHNIGDANAKNVLLTMEFNGLEVVEVIEGKFKSIDRHRGGKPSLQFDLVERVLHPRKEIRNIFIGEVLFKLKEPRKEIEIEYDVVADDMKFFKDIYRIKPKLKSK